MNKVRVKARLAYSLNPFTECQCFGAGLPFHQLLFYHWCFISPTPTCHGPTEAPLFSNCLAKPHFKPCAYLTNIWVGLARNLSRAIIGHHINVHKWNDNQCENILTHITLKRYSIRIFEHWIIKWITLLNSLIKSSETLSALYWDKMWRMDLNIVKCVKQSSFTQLLSKFCLLMTICHVI